MKYSLFIGRYQPLHTGHIKLIRKVLDEGKGVCIGLRDTPSDKDNPYSLLERYKMCVEEFSEEIHTNMVIVTLLPDIEEVCYGRKVGWGIREIKLDEKTEKISATEIRRKLNQKNYKVKNEKD